MSNLPRHASAPLAIGVILLVTAGCATQADPGVSPEPSSPDHSPTSGEPIEPIEPIAGGDCDALIDLAALAATLGGATDPNPLFTGAYLPELGIVGGLGCYWYFGEQGYSSSTSLSLAVVPARIADASQIDEHTARDGECQTEGDPMVTNSGCRASAEVNGWWYEFKLFANQSLVAQQDALEPTRAMVESALDLVTPPSDVPELAPMDCADVEVAGVGASNHVVADDGSPGPIAAARRLVVPTRCVITSADGADLYFTVYPHASSPYERCAIWGNLAASGREVVLAGAARATAFPHEITGGEPMCATDGSSSIELASPVPAGQDASTWDDTALEFADAVLASVFAAAS